MKIECKLQRAGGTIVDIGGTEYHFKPGADGAHVADIENDEHIDRFLAIAEAYRLYREAKSEPVEGDVDGDGDADRADLVLQYKDKFGKAPHGKWSADKIRAELAAA